LTLCVPCYHCVSPVVLCVPTCWCCVSPVVDGVCPQLFVCPLSHLCVPCCWCCVSPVVTVCPLLAALCVPSHLSWDQAIFSAIFHSNIQISVCPQSLMVCVSPVIYVSPVVCVCPLLVVLCVPSRWWCVSPVICVSPVAFVCPHLLMLCVPSRWWCVSPVICVSPVAFVCPHLLVLCVLSRPCVSSVITVCPLLSVHAVCPQSLALYPRECRIVLYFIQATFNCVELIANLLRLLVLVASCIPWLNLCSMQSGISQQGRDYMVYQALFFFLDFTYSSAQIYLPLLIWLIWNISNMSELVTKKTWRVFAWLLVDFNKIK